MYSPPNISQDIDMVVLTSSHTQEELKNRLVSYDSRFYTVASKDPFATYRVLWFRLSGYRRSCKVDLLLPGVMNIPHVPSDRIYRMKDHPTSASRSTSSSNTTTRHPSTSSAYYSYLYTSTGSGSLLSNLSTDYPLMPFLPLLLLKLQAWQDHGESPKAYMREKQPTDVRDITELLNLAVTKYSGAVSRKQTLLEKERAWLPETFVRDGEKRVKKYIQLYPSSRSQWRTVGFHTSDTVLSKRSPGLKKMDDDGRMRRLENLMNSLAFDDY